MTTAIERLLSTERFQQRAARGAGHSSPVMQERPSSAEEGPFLATNMKRNFLPTRASVQGLVRFGFSTVPLGEEDCLLEPLHTAICAHGTRERCISVRDGIQRLRSTGFEARTVVLPESRLSEICGTDFDRTKARALQKAQGYVALVDGMQVLVGDLPSDKALVATVPALVGVYSRIGESLGILLFRVDRTVVAVTRGVDG